MCMNRRKTISRSFNHRTVSPVALSKAFMVGGKIDTMEHESIAYGVESNTSCAQKFIMRIIIVLKEHVPPPKYARNFARNILSTTLAIRRSKRCH